MKKKDIIITIVGIILVIAGAIAYVALQPKPEQQPVSSASQNTEEPQPNTPQPEPTQTAGKYVNYDTAALAATSGRKVLFFHAAWCPQCRNLEKTILEGKIPEKMTIFKVNFDTETSLRQKYGVTMQTTVVEVDDQGKELKKFVAYDDPSLNAVLKALGN